MRKAIMIAAALALTPLVPAMAQQGPQFAQGQFQQQQQQEVPLYLGPTVVREVQIELSRQGFNPGIVNGAWTPQTASALQAYQQTAGIEPTGNIDIATLHSLGVPRAILRAMVGERIGERVGEGLGERLGERFAERGQALGNRLGERIGERIGERLGGGSYGYAPGGYSMQQQQPYGYQGFGSQQGYQQGFGPQQGFGTQGGYGVQGGPGAFGQMQGGQGFQR